MSSITLSITSEAYRCEPCSKKQGTDVTELIRMIPMSIVLEGKLVGDEFWSCPICLRPKFHVRTRRKFEDLVADARAENNKWRAKRARKASGAVQKAKEGKAKKAKSDSGKPERPRLSLVSSSSDSDS
jgi:hypothetical protein